FSIYLFWTGFATAGMATVLYIAYVASASVSLHRVSAQTEMGTITLSGATGQPNPSLGYLATTFTVFTVLFLFGQVVTRWDATGHAPISDLYEFTAAFAFGIAAAYLVFETVTRQRRVGVLAAPIVVLMLFIASLFPNDITPLIPA